MLPEFAQPSAHLVKRRSGSDVVAEKRCVCAAIVEFAD